MAKASDNVFPKVLVIEGSAPASPASGNQALYIDTADHKLKRKDSSGSVTTIESSGGGSVLVDAYVEGTGSADQNVTSTTFVDITSLSTTIAAATSDRLVIVTELVLYGSNTGMTIDTCFAIAGTDQTGHMCRHKTEANTSPQPVLHTQRYVVQAGDISGGTVAVKARVKVSANTGSIANASGFLPILHVLNLSH